MFGFGKKMTEEEAEKLHQQQLEEIRRKRQEQEDRNKKIERYHVDRLKEHLKSLPVDTLNIIFSQAVFNMCYESFLQTKHSWDVDITLNWGESNLASNSVKLVIEKYRELDRKLKGQFHFYMMKACQELVAEKENKNEETPGS